MIERELVVTILSHVEYELNTMKSNYTNSINAIRDSCDPNTNRKCIKLTDSINSSCNSINQHIYNLKSLYTELSPDDLSDKTQSLWHNSDSDTEVNSYANKATSVPGYVSRVFELDMSDFDEEDEVFYAPEVSLVEDDEGLFHSDCCIAGRHPEEEEEEFDYLQQWERAAESSRSKSVTVMTDDEGEEQEQEEQEEEEEEGPPEDSPSSASSAADQVQRERGMKKAASEPIPRVSGGGSGSGSNTPLRRASTVGSPAPPGTPGGTPTISRMFTGESVNKPVVRQIFERYCVDDSSNSNNSSSSSSGSGSAEESAVIPARQLQILCYDLGVYVSLKDAERGIWETLQCTHLRPDCVLRYSDFLVWWRNSRFTGVRLADPATVCIMSISALFRR